MKQPSTYPRQPRTFFCQKCGARVYRPSSDRFDDSICLNCWYGPARAD
ncbi:hypothetical protein [Bradyrhizobium sp. CCBAU 51753]|nr:hypothetical protein [Bradyrhizobium sp. CCBAU 51753]